MTLTLQQNMTKQRVRIQREIKTYPHLDLMSIARLTEMMRRISVTVRPHLRLSEELWSEISFVLRKEMFPGFRTGFNINQHAQSLKNARSLKFQIYFIFFYYSVLRPFQDYFSSYETGQSVGGQKQENPEKNHLTHPQAELWHVSHMARAGLEPTLDTAVR